MMLTHSFICYETITEDFLCIQSAVVMAIIMCSLLGFIYKMKEFVTSLFITTVIV